MLYMRSLGTEFFHLGFALAPRVKAALELVNSESGHVGYSTLPAATEAIDIKDSGFCEHKHSAH